MTSPPPFVVSRTADTVEAWSSARLPFEPKGWLIELRAALREALADLTPSGRTCLTATYTSADTSACDVENVLLYNVGYRPFRHLTLQQLRLRRRLGTGAPSACHSRRHSPAPSPLRVDR